jgi:hypothetical protein
MRSRNPDRCLKDWVHLRVESPPKEKLSGGSCVRRISLESRACSEPNFQPELDEAPEPCVSPRHDAAKRAIGTSIGEDNLRP